jgi:acetyltransferase-like isoleucine patch superfamily enzyme
MNILQLFNKIIFKIKLLRATPQEVPELFRNKFYHLGHNVKLYTYRIGTEPYLISIHDNVVCAANVEFITHDVSCFNIARYKGISDLEVDKVGSIELFDNAFVGANTLLMPNCSVGKNSVVAAGSIVTKKIPDGEVWGGVPAKFIMTTEDYATKILKESKNYPWMQDKTKLSNAKLITLRQRYLFKNK